MEGQWLNDYLASPQISEHELTRKCTIMLNNWLSFSHSFSLWYASNRRPAARLHMPKKRKSFSIAEMVRLENITAEVTIESTNRDTHKLATLIRNKS